MADIIAISVLNFSSLPQFRSGTLDDCSIVLRKRINERCFFPWPGWDIAHIKRSFSEIGEVCTSRPGSFSTEPFTYLKCQKKLVNTVAYLSYFLISGRKWGRSLLAAMKPNRLCWQWRSTVQQPVNVTFLQVNYFWRRMWQGSEGQ